jgi:hypothetical protein
VGNCNTDFFDIHNDKAPCFYGGLSFANAWGRQSCHQQILVTTASPAAITMPMASLATDFF